MIASALLATTASAESARYTAILGGKNVGHVIVDRQGDSITVDYDIKNNGRGPTMNEELTLGTDGLPTKWSIVGTTTFGSKVAEQFARAGDRATWTD